MTPPEPTTAGNDALAVDQAPAVSVCLEGMKKRADFLRTARGRRQATPGFVLQAIKRPESGDQPAIRIGFTCSKKVGNAVTRNRAKRRLREIARRAMPTAGQPGWDYVLIGRAGKTVDVPFEVLLADLQVALDKVHGDAR